ncbi:hypothetical protein DAPPUDRAFT_244750 [Daphnia pulex]|uniref:Uncharacterized protein n=1 Tax=Daphnia pulex TaxID=6669 RepID=E9GLQ9_DAPPU|nr:hypothetical protein DAPPUDRAFT_244750 [Daphnia pulex]|eukprot:EFX79548.1 hypothetical protein DAPPUDRAFT_244750 [Daphnia pulex]
MYCRYGRYGLDMFLNYFESSLISMLGWQAVAQQQLTQDFHQVVEYCCTYPQRIWTQFALKKDEITLRLLRLCIALRTRKEGLEILKILGSEFKTRGKKQILSFVGIQNEQVAQALVQFVCQSNGLGDCIDLIKNLITTHRIFKQFVPITKMIQYFLDAKCVEGAVLVGDGVASSLNNFDQKRVAVLKKPDISLYVDAIVSLEAYPEASSQERLASLVSLFSKLGSSLRCRLVVQLDAQVSVSRSSYPYQFYGDTLPSILAKYLQFVLEAERIPELADAHRLSSISLLLSQMKYNQLYHILDVFHKSSSEHWNTSPCYSDMMRDICKSMVSTMKNVKPIRGAVSKIVRFFFDFLDKSLSQSLLMEVCGFQAAGCWSHNIKYEFFSDIISSTEVWDKLDSVAKLDILNTCATLIESWIIEECKALDEISWTKKTQEEFFNCIDLFFLIEEHRFNPKQKNTITNRFSGHC